MGVCAMVFCCTVMMVDSVFIKSTPLCHSNCPSSWWGCSSDSFVCLVYDPFNLGDGFLHSVRTIRTEAGFLRKVTLDSLADHVFLHLHFHALDLLQTGVGFPGQLCRIGCILFLYSLDDAPLLLWAGFRPLVHCPGFGATATATALPVVVFGDGAVEHDGVVEGWGEVAFIVRFFL